MLDISIKKKIGAFFLEAEFNIGNEIVGIIGPSGSGKSLTLQSIAGFQSPDEGRIMINDRSLYDTDNKVNIPSSKRKIGYVFQNYALFPHLNVEKNIAFGIQQLKDRERKDRVNNLLETMGLRDYGASYPSSLSGGQQQRVALARALATRPELLLLDEPFSAVDTHLKGYLEEALLESFRRGLIQTVLIVTHNIEEAYRLCHKIIVYAEGKIVQIAQNKEMLIRHPASATVARMVGCKNLLNVEVIGEDCRGLLLKTNDMVLQTVRKVDYYRHMVAGVHPVDLKISTQKVSNVNCFPCRISEVIEAPYLNTLKVKCQGYMLHVDVAKEEWRQFKQGADIEHFIYIPPEKIFLIA